MVDQLRNHLSSPKKLEDLYRSDRSAFHKAFNELYPEIREQPLAEFWDQRLNYKEEKISLGGVREWSVLIVLALFAGTFAKFPVLFDWDEERFFTRNISFLVFPFLCIYFTWKQGIKGWIPIAALLVLALCITYNNLLPEMGTTQSIPLALIHSGIFMACLPAVFFVYNEYNSPQRRIAFLRYYSDLVVMCALLVPAGGILVGISLGLFSAIGIKLEDFYSKYVIVYGGLAIPIVATHLVRVYPALVNKVSPIIAKLFAPLVLITLSVYLPASLLSGKSPYQDRDFLIVFNALLVGVMAIIIFTLAEGSSGKWGLLMLFVLACLTLLVNAVALSAIGYRIMEYGLTPNKAAVLGGNLIILIHLLLVTAQLFRAVRSGTTARLESSLANYLPVYMAWAFFVAFFFPMIFQGR